MKFTQLIFFILFATAATAQLNVDKWLKECKVDGSVTIYNYKKRQWLMSDSVDANKTTQPASTFKIINLLIALETGVIKDEKQVIKWPGKTDTVLYGYRPEIYKDMTVQRAFEISAGWTFIELAKKIGKEKYKHFLDACGYGNANLSEKADDFWNYGAFGISPKNQVEFLIKLFERKLLFSRRNIRILEKVMITAKTKNYTLRSKTGWTRIEDQDIGWWVGYVSRKDNTYFFATRITKKRSVVNPSFGECRKTITRNVLKALKAIE